MTALVLVLGAVVLVLCVLVAGLLGAYADVLRRLHELDGGSGWTSSPVVGPGTVSPTFRTAADVPAPPHRQLEGRAEWSEAFDVAGVGLSGEIVHARAVGVGHDTVIAFLSSGCAGCTGFWEELALPATWALFGGARLLVVTKGADQESPAALAAMCPPGVDLIMSTGAWASYGVPGSPFVAVVDGRTGRVKGEGSGASFTQVAALIAQAVGDATGPAAVRKPTSDLEREHDADRVLLEAGITPGHSSLFGPTR